MFNYLLILETKFGTLLEKRKVMLYSLSLCLSSYCHTQNFLKTQCYFSFPVTRILDACDELRDVSLPELGVKLEDVEGKHQWILSSFSVWAHIISPSLSSLYREVLVFKMYPLLKINNSLNFFEMRS